MKKTFVALSIVALFAVSFSACKKDNTPQCWKISLSTMGVEVSSSYFWGTQVEAEAKAKQYDTIASTCKAEKADKAEADCTGGTLFFD